MFTDVRSKKVVFIAHCLLNQNSISDGTAVFPAAFKEVIQRFLDADVGIIGANRSPNCGIETTSNFDTETDGKGIFMEELSRRLAAENQAVPMTGLKISDDIAQKLAPLLQTD